MTNKNHTEKRVLTVSTQVTIGATNRKVLEGGCLWGKVHFKLTDQFNHFHLCHCQQCQKLTGSAFAANIFTAPENIVWLAGDEGVSYYKHPSRGLSKVFCSDCGSALPFVNKIGKALIVSAGSLFDKVEHVPEANFLLV